MYEKLKARICELVPEIMELKFGCVYQSKKRDNKLFFTVRTNFEVDSLKNNPDIIVVGRPITLEDVLSAAGSKINGDCFVDDGKFMIWPPDSYIPWQLGKPLSEQSEEMWEAIYELIK